MNDFKPKVFSLALRCFSYFVVVFSVLLQQLNWISVCFYVFLSFFPRTNTFFRGGFLFSNFSWWKRKYLWADCFSNSKSLSIWTNFKIRINYTDGREMKMPTACQQAMFNRVEQIIDINNASSLIKLKSFLVNSETYSRHFVNVSFWMRINIRIK